MGNSHLYLDIEKCDGGITVTIAAFQAVDPGSTPGHRKYFFFAQISILIQLQ